ncbi:MAG: putative SOS response-associated peptidase YedK [Herbaspirillum frisingense]|uniref:Abasic site processing protein n=1 Tax=Herbaspirillum frisingense TaxID=92645 RepID=A0A7V8FSL4_9BURK|nr:MAG: putative SOS response-associated peptidase YedK [Herbaspirillum frisingense]
MCGRITQGKDADLYLGSLAKDAQRVRRVNLQPFHPDFNALPSSQRLIVRIDQDGMLAELRPWAYLSGWARSERKPPAINARLDKLGNGYYRQIMKHGRVIVPADGWYEWTGVKGSKQPWYIHPTDGQPLFFAGLADHYRDGHEGETPGFVIVTDDAQGGMIDIHDRRPVALTADDAALWMDLDLSYEQAAEIARVSARPTEDFQWHKVSTAINGIRNHGPELIDPIAEES